MRKTKTKKEKASDNETDHEMLDMFERISEVSGHVEGQYTQWLKLKNGKATLIKFRAASFFPAETIALAGYAVPSWALERNGLVVLLTPNDAEKDGGDGEPYLLTQPRLIRQLVAKMQRAMSEGVLKVVHDPNELAWMTAKVPHDDFMFELTVKRATQGGERAPYMLDNLDLIVTTEG
jgi:hypothetical protein